MKTDHPFKQGLRSLLSVNQTQKTGYTILKFALQATSAGKLRGVMTTKYYFAGDPDKFDSKKMMSTQREKKDGQIV